MECNLLSCTPFCLLNFIDGYGYFRNIIVIYTIIVTSLNWKYIHLTMDDSLEYSQGDSIKYNPDKRLQLNVWAWKLCLSNSYTKPNIISIINTSVYLANQFFLSIFSIPLSTDKIFSISLAEISVLRQILPFFITIISSKSDR